jgi:hypothetical protein
MNQKIFQLIKYLQSNNINMSNLMKEFDSEDFL